MCSICDTAEESNERAIERFRIYNRNMLASWKESERRAIKLTQVLVELVACAVNDSDHCRYCEKDISRHASDCLIVAAQLVLGSPANPGAAKPSNQGD